MPESKDSPKDFVDQLLVSKAAQAAQEKALKPPPKTRRAANGTAKQKWLEKTLQEVIDDIRSTPEGGRNARLRWGARRLGEISHAGLDEARCKRELERAAEDNGLWKEDGAHQCKASIENGWTAGVKDPEDLSHVGTQTSGSGIKAETKTNGKTNSTAKTNGHAPEAADVRTVELQWLDGVKTTVPHWVWKYGGKGRLQLGTLALFAGKPAAGKSTAARFFAARISKGELEGCWEGHPMRVAVMMTEEQTDAIVVPGLELAGADKRMIANPKFKFNGVESTMMSQSDEERLTNILIDNEIRAVFIDPIMATFSGRVDVYRANEVRENLAPFTRIAQAINGIVVGVVHLRKGEVKEVLGNINGSSAFGEVPRSVLGFAPVPGTEERILEQVKNSAGPCDLKLSYGLPIGHLTSSDGQPIELPTFEILGETETSISDINADGDETSGIAVACEWLKMYLLENQPAPSADVKRDAKKYGDIGDRMIVRAAKRMGVKITTQSRPDKPYTTVWQLKEFGEWLKPKNFSRNGDENIDEEDRG
jgi:hypothetical protein